MITLPGFAIRSEIFEGRQSRIYRASRQQDDLPVILKLLKKEYPSAEEIARFSREFRMTAALEIAGVIDVYSLEKYQNSQIIVMEDFGGDSLDIHLQAGVRWTLERFLDLAIRLSRILGQIHRQQMIHKDINPSNIVWNLTTDTIKVIDFGISTQLAKETPDLQHPRLLEGTLAYMSPEQTGRMNRSIDYRTDLYALGATFYRLLTGKLPFDTTDLLELVHCHVARQPEAPVVHRPDIPPVLSQIVLKLMAKNVEERYQSAFGLEQDLIRCQKQVNEDITVAFALGEQDHSDRLVIPQKLYGREAELRRLTQSFTRVSQGSSELVLVTGYAGIGKTALIREIHPQLVRSKGNYIAGKFDQYKRNIPYSALIQAFQDLIRQLLALSPAELLTWKQDLDKALGRNSRVVADVIPELEQIVGKTPDLPELGPVETRNRFNLVFQSFIKVFTQQDAPLVLFLDDLQWADGASLQLIRLFLTDPETRYLMMIGAYRDNEVDTIHPLTLMIDELQQEKASIEQISLQPLKEEDINHFLIDTFRRDPSDSKDLTTLCLKKTQGNPFFLGQLLLSLYEEQLIHFDPDHRQWTWDIEQLHQVAITDNVVELMVKKINSLSETTRELLKLAACIGNTFDLSTLALVHKKSIRETGRELWESLKEGLVIPLDDTYKFSEETDDFISRFRFIHDRVQQAAYSLIMDESRPQIHRSIGLILLNNRQQEYIEEHLFEIVNHLNISSQLVENYDERLSVIKLNLRASQKMKTSLAYLSALNCLQTAIEHLGADPWKSEYKLTLDIYQQIIEVSYLSGNYKLMDNYANSIFKSANSLLDKIDTYEIKIQSGLARDRLVDSLQLALKILKELEFKVKTKNSRLFIIYNLIKIRYKLKKFSLNEIINCDLLVDEEKLAIMKITSSVIVSSLILSPDVLVLFAIKMVDISLSYGISKYSPESFVILGFIFIASGMDIDLGHKLGNVGLSLIERTKAYDRNCRIITIFEGFLDHWKVHVAKTINPCKFAHNEGMKNGDEFTSLSILLVSYHRWVFGYPINKLIQEFEENIQTLKKLKQKNMIYISKIYLQILYKLSGIKDQKKSLKNDAFDEIKDLDYLKQIGENTSISTYYRNNGFLCYLFHQFETAFQFIQKEADYVNSIIGSVGYPLYFFQDSLFILVIIKNRSVIEKIKLMNRISKNQRKLKKWAKHAPMNHMHKYLLVEAERARVRGKHKQAMKLYDESIRLAKENEYLQEEALANEVAGRYYLAEGHTQIARSYLTEARYLYDRWGAKAKVKHLEETYPELLAFKRSAETQTGGSLTGSLSPTTSTAGEHESVVDLQAVLKTSRAISGEIRLENLLSTLVKVAVENAGAQRGLLLSVDGSNIFLESEAKGSPLEVSLGASLLVEEQEDLPVTIIRYVAQTGERLILNDACREGRFTGTAYITSHHPQSVLCVPIQIRGKTSAILYLEHHLSTHAFPLERLEVLNLLFSQAAISLENARLYQQTEQALEAEKTARRKQEQADRLKDEFLANTSHELRTPLHGMIGLSESLLHGLQPQLQPKQQKDLHSIIASGKRLSSLVNDILDFSRLKQGDLELHPRAVHLHSVVELVMGVSIPLIGNKSLTLVNLVPRELPPVFADENRLQQILHNLIGNALKFTNQGSVKVSAAVKADGIYFTVSDTGSGIASKDLERIFNKFEQLDGSITRKHQGTGLGLAITRKLVEAHQGTISVTSTLGKGSGFVVSLPVANPSQQAVLPPEKKHQPHPAAQPVPNPPAHLKSEADAGAKPLITILVVDDDPVNLQVVESQLRDQPYHVILATDGQEALTIIDSQGKPDLVLLDIMMPNMSGFELCQKLRERFPAYELPVLFLTAKNQVSDLVEGFALGANDYLPKPFSRQELLARIRNQIQLLQSGNRLSSLRRIARDLERMKEAEQMMLAIAGEINQTLDLAESILFGDDHILQHIKHSANYTLLNRKSEEPQVNGYLPGEGEEMAVIDSLTENHSAYPFCQSLSQVSVKGSHWLLIRMTGFEAFLLCLYRSPDQGPFTNLDREYMKSILREVHLKRQTLQNTTLDIKHNQNLITIAEHLEKILYVQGGKSMPYSELVMEPDLNRELPIRITLQQIQTFFPETVLLRIHNSYLINPRKVSSQPKPIRKRGDRDLELALQTSDGKQKTCPISRRYLENLKRLYPHWFH